MRPKSNRWFVDTNVLLDIAVPTRKGFHEDALLLYDTVGKSDVILYASVAVLKDVYYLLCRNYCDESKARDAIRIFMNTLAIVGLTKSMAETALGSDEPDFEDSLVRVAAETCECKYIISRDMKAFKNSTAERIDPATAYKLLVN